MIWGIVFTQIIQQSNFQGVLSVCFKNINNCLNFILKVEEIYDALLITKIGWILLLED